MSKCIRNVFMLEGDAHEVARQIRDGGTRARVYKRTARAGGTSCWIWVIVVDRN